MSVPMGKLGGALKAFCMMTTEGMSKTMDHTNEDNREARKMFYVSVQAGQILEDQQAAPYELEIYATEEEVGRLRELFEEFSTMDEAAAFHFSRTFLETDHDATLNRATDELVNEIYRQIYNCGTEGTKRHIESMGLF